MVRTLWNNVTYPAGTHAAYWDRKDDNGFLMEDTSYVVRVLSNNITYQWEGVVGNTSDSLTGLSKHVYFFRPSSMVIINNFAYYCVGYTEGVTAIYKFNTATPQQKVGILYNTNHDVDLETDFTASDGTNVYWAGRDPFNTDVNMVYATSVSEDKEVLFSSGASVSMTYGRTYNAALDLYTDNPDSRPSGLAVQKAGKYLFVAHAGLNELHVLNKTTGALVQNISVNKPRNLCTDASGNLWMISDTNALQKYKVNEDGTLTSAVLKLSNLVDPIALSVSPNNYQILVADGGSSQQIKAFNNATGSLIWTLGETGGYSRDPEVKNTKFYFSDQNEIRGSFIAFQSDSSFWIGDPGNERIMRFSAYRNHLNTVMSLPHSYSVEVDRNDPTRVFNEYLEFKVDYSKPLAPNNGSWTLVKNWRAGVPANYYQYFKVNILKNVITHQASGRTYATFDDLSDPNNKTPEIVELPSSGNLRFTGVKLSPWVNFLIDSDFNLRTLNSNGDSGAIAFWESRKLIQFKDGNPEWETDADTIAKSPISVLMDPLSDNPSAPVKTASDLLVVFNPWKVNSKNKGRGYHLGAIRKGSNQWLWMTSHATSENYNGSFPTDGSFDIGNNVEYPGGNAYAIDNSIFWNYHGEFWKNSQTNLWNHFYDNGLMLGQFGTNGPEALAKTEAAPAEMAGNVFSGAVVKVGNDYYVYHNDEFHHSGIHRWKISKLNSIQVESIDIHLPIVKTGAINIYQFNNSDIDNSGIRFVRFQNKIRPLEFDKVSYDSTSFSLRYEAYIKPDSNFHGVFILQTNKGINLRLDGKELVSKWKNNKSSTFISDSVFLNKNRSYYLELETNSNTFALTIESDGKKLEIPQSWYIQPLLKPVNEWKDLLLLLPYQTELFDTLYGWSVPHHSKDTTTNQIFFQTHTNIKSWSKQERDIQLSLFKDSFPQDISRRLGDLPNCLSEWESIIQVSLEGNQPNGNIAQGISIDVLDSFERVILKIQFEIRESYNYSRNFAITCNGEDVYNKKLSSNLAEWIDPFTIALKMTESNCSISVNNNSSTCPTHFDQDANNLHPTHLRFNLESNTNAPSRYLNISKLYFKALQKPYLLFNDTGIKCQGDFVELYSPNMQNKVWSTGETENQIKVYKSGDYWLIANDNNACKTQSFVKYILINDTPNVQIISSNKQLISNYNFGNQWYLNDSILEKETSKILVASRNGSYHLLVTDSNHCIGRSDKTDYTSALNQPIAVKSLLIYPNPNSGFLTVSIQINGQAHLRVLNSLGIEVYTKTIQDNRFELPPLPEGIYTLFITQNNIIYHSNFSYINNS